MEIKELVKNNIHIFKTDSKTEHLSSDDAWREKYITFLGIEDVDK